jgi:phosphoribosylformimino-5-aminoimidazole carboxamide ribotide isomerase
MIVYPAIDIMEGKVVRLERGKYDAATEYGESPLDTARRYADLGFRYLHVVDLLASKRGQITVTETLEEIIEETGLRVEFGGGVRQYEDVERLIDIGADRVVVGSLAIKDKPKFESIAKAFGGERITLGADVREGRVAVRGWTEKSPTTVEEHVQYGLDNDVDVVLCTDVSRDGMMLGPNVELYQSLARRFPDLKLVASGGVSSIDDVKRLRDEGMYATIVGKAIYEGAIDPKELATLVG